METTNKENTSLKEDKPNRICVDTKKVALLDESEGNEKGQDEGAEINWIRTQSETWINHQEKGTTQDNVIHALKFEKVKNQLTGSLYEGPVINGWMRGRGRYYYPNGIIYDGNFLKGDFHGDGVLIYPNGGRFMAKWERGKAVKGYYVFDDNLRYDTSGWKYLQEDRRFHSEMPNPEFLSSRLLEIQLKKIDKMETEKRSQEKSERKDTQHEDSEEKAVFGNGGGEILGECKNNGENKDSCTNEENVLPLILNSEDHAVQEALERFRSIEKTIDREVFTATADDEFNDPRKAFMQIQQYGRKIPPNMYDTGNGYYNPSTRKVYQYDGSCASIEPNEIEIEWIVTHCRKG